MITVSDVSTKRQKVQSETQYKYAIEHATIIPEQSPGALSTSVMIAQIEVNASIERHDLPNITMRLAS